jgi:hypothetical protein
MSQPSNDRNQAASSGTADSKHVKLERAQAVLRWAGFRILDIGGKRYSCVWATRDGPWCARRCAWPASASCG